MLKELAKKMGLPIRDRMVFDPSTIDDPLAIRTKWTAARSGGASFCTHQLVRTSAERFEFKPSAGARFFYLIFIIVGSGLLLYFSFAGVAGKSDEVFIPLLVGLVFTTVGSVMLYLGTTPIVFDKGRGFFWKNRRGPEKTTTHSSARNFTRIENIHAMQLVSEYCRGNKSSFYSYELNLVLANGRRINVVDHGNIESLQKDARTLAAFLDIPVWDAT